MQIKRLSIVLSNGVALSASETSRRLAKTMSRDSRRRPERTSNNLNHCVIRRVRPTNTNSKLTVRCTSLHRRIVVAFRLRKSTALPTPCFGRFRCAKTTLSCFLLATTSLRSVSRATVNQAITVSIPQVETKKASHRSARLWLPLLGERV